MSTNRQGFTDWEKTLVLLLKVKYTSLFGPCDERRFCLKVFNVMEHAFVKFELEPVEGSNEKVNKIKF